MKLKAIKTRLIIKKIEEKNIDKKLIQTIIDTDFNTKDYTEAVNLINYLMLLVAFVFE